MSVIAKADTSPCNTHMFNNPTLFVIVNVFSIIKWANLHEPFDHNLNLPEKVIIINYIEICT